MREVLMLMRTVLPGVLMLVHLGIVRMGMLMGMFMEMLMSVGVGVLMQMDFLPMPVLMAMHVGMLMGVQVLMFVLAFHGCLPLLEKNLFNRSPIPYRLHLPPRFAGNAA